MKCPACGHQNSVVKDSRPQDNLIYRRRQCLNTKCGRKWSTHEAAVDAAAMGSIKIEVHATQRALQNALDHLGSIEKKLKAD